MTSIREQIQQLTDLNLKVSSNTDLDPEDDGTLLANNIETGALFDDESDKVQADASRGPQLRMKTSSGSDFGKAYEGIRVDRNNSESDSELAANGNGQDLPDGYQYHDDLSEDKEDSDPASDDYDDYDDGDDDDEMKEEAFDEKNHPKRENTSSIDLVSSKLHKEHNSDVEKGHAICAQLGIWDRLLELRIKLQNPLQSSNKYPQHGSIKAFQDVCPKFTNGKASLKSNLINILEKLVTLEKNLLQSNQSSQSHKSSLQESDEELDDISSEIEEESGVGALNDVDNEESHASDVKNVQSHVKQKHIASQFETEVADMHCKVRQYVDPIISKWDGKARLSSGKDLKKGFSSFDRSTLSQVNRIMLDKKRLLRRTKLKRSAYRALGMRPKELSHDIEMKEAADSHLKNYDDQIYDDDDFYHQMLKEFIGRSTNSMNESQAIGRKWLDLHNLRSKGKKGVETKATKGRKIRYNVHSKLLNFMTPVSAGPANDQSRNDLFRSLFGNKTVGRYEDQAEES